MKKIMLLLSVSLMAGMLSACSPTVVDDASRPKVQIDPETEAPTAAGERRPDPTTPAIEMMFVFRGNEDATKLERVQTYAPEMNEQVLLDKLIGFGVLEEGTEILSFNVEGDIPRGPGALDGAVDGERIGTLDLSQVPSSGTAGETLMLEAIGNTFIENFELDKLKLLVNGANYESEHIVQGDDEYLEYVSEYVNVSDNSDEEL